MQGNYNLGNYSQQLGLSQDELGRAYETAGGGNPYAAQAAPVQQAPAQQQPAGGLQTVGQMHDLAGGGGESSSSKEKKSGLDNALGIVGKVLSFL